LLALAGLGTVFVALHRLQLTLDGAPERRVFAAPDATADALLVGCFLGLLYCSGTLHRIVEKAAWRRVAVPLAAAGMAAAFVLVPNTDWRPLYESVLPFVGLASAVVVGEAACGRGGWLTRLLEQRRLVWVGTISYGFYLWHPVLLYGTGLRLPLPSVLAALAVARLSYVYVEQPFLRRRRGKTAAHDRPSVVAAPAALPSTATP
jgi:peptidoglycan/LPS O-acetylase OafA/YrhL